MARPPSFCSEATRQICKAVGIDPGMTRRLIIDLPHDGPATLYVEMYASDETLDIDWKQALDGAKVITIGDKNVPG